MELDNISAEIIEAAFRVHTALGPGLLESAYEACLTYELQQQGLFVERQKELSLIYNGVTIDVGYRLDLLVNDTIILELKAVEKFHPVHQAQLLSYLKLSGKKLGLLLNFNVIHMKDGIKRMVNGL
ncbi:MAG: GxxExxY protein [Treponemataceae bacterium]